MILNHNKVYIGRIVDVGIFGDAVVAFPVEMMFDLGWQEGDSINITLEDGVIVLKNLTKEGKK